MRQEINLLRIKELSPKAENLCKAHQPARVKSQSLNLCQADPQVPALPIAHIATTCFVPEPQCVFHPKTSLLTTFYEEITRAATPFDMQLSDTATLNVNNLQKRRWILSSFRVSESKCPTLLLPLKIQS